MKRNLKVWASVAALAVSLTACAGPQPDYQAPPTAYAPAYVPPPEPQNIRVAMEEGYVDGAIDGICCARMLVDSGASDVSVPLALFQAMVQGGHITQADAIDVTHYSTASDAVIEGLRFRLPPLTIGGHTVYNVIGSVSEHGGQTILLGQSFLKSFRFWAIDNQTGQLVLGL